MSLHHTFSSLAQHICHRLPWRSKSPATPEAGQTISKDQISAKKQTPILEQTSAFLHLPLDIVQTICEELPLSSNILLSHSCRTMWNTLGTKSSVELKSLARQERFTTLTELANLLPDDLHCLECNSLHRVDPNDYPSRPEQKYSPIPCTLYLCLPRYNAWSVGPYYVVAFRHIQLALKYFRIKQQKYQGYRMDLLKQIEYSSSGLSVVKTSTAKPKVVQGLRFLVSATFVLDANALRCQVERFWSTTSFCAHHIFCLQRDWSLDTDTFTAMLYRAAAINATATATRDERVQLFSCDECPTDYQIVAAEDNEVVVRAFYDLGTGQSSVDPYWRSHLRSRHNDPPYTKSYFDYEHGSISRMYHGSDDDQHS